MVCSMGISAFAAENNWQGGTTVTYVGKGNANYEVTVPATMAPGDEATVTHEGTWASNNKNCFATSYFVAKQIGQVEYHYCNCADDGTWCILYDANYEYVEADAPIENNQYYVSDN